MHGTHSTIGATLCGVILPNGRDCNGGVPEGAPINLCDEHFAVAFRWERARDHSARPLSTCDICDREAVMPGRQGSRCEHCGDETADYLGLDPSQAELDRLDTLFEARDIVSHPQRHPDVVYYIRFGDQIKIGTTRNLTQRLRAIPHDEVLGIERGGADVERRRHNQFRKDRRNGEWFTATTELTLHARMLMGSETDWQTLVWKWKHQR